MKKILFATTALAAVSLASGSIAQESAMMTPAGNTLNIGGYYEFGWTSLSDDYEGADDGGDAFTYGDSELYIDFENTADNGLTYGVQIDIEVNTGNHGEDSGDDNGKAEESSIYISGDFGTVHLGHDDPAFGRFQIWAPTHEGTLSQDDSVHYFQFVDNSEPAADRVRIDDALWYSAAGVGNSYNDDAKLTYVSPSFNGFSFGASMSDSDSEADNPNSFGLQYSGDIGPGTLTVAGATETNNADGNDKVTSTHYGVSYGMGAFTVTVGRAKGKAGGANATSADIEREVTEFGVGFQVSDQLSVGASTASSETEQAVSASANADAMGLDQEGTFRSVSGSYTIAPGLKTTLALNQFDVENNLNANHKNDGSEIVWQVEFSF